MRRFPLATALVLPVFSAAIWAQTGPRSEPENLNDVVSRLIGYHDFGEYDYQIREVANSARTWLETVAKERRPGEKLAAVFDIDETSLSNWKLMLDCGFCSYSAQKQLYPFPSADSASVPCVEDTKAQCNPANIPVIVPVLELFRFAKDNGFGVFFVTGRPESQRALTEKNLRDEGYPPWDHLYMRAKGNGEPASTIKPRNRRQIADMGYRIVLNIGDQASDLAGCCSERVFKLPNPFYLVK